MAPNWNANQGPLSSREREIAKAYARGDSYRRIADSLFIAPSTVRTHLATIYRKLGVSSKIELHNVLEGANPEHRERGDSEALISELALSLEEALSRERALGEVLKIISQTQGNLQEVIAAVLGYTLDLCDAEFGIVFDYEERTGYRATHMRGIPKAFEDWLSKRDAFHVGPQTGLGRIAANRALVNIPDVRTEDVYQLGDPLRIATVNLGGARSFAAIPMLVGDYLIGAFTVYRQQVRPFDATTLRLVQMFADQSVIAIENARLVSKMRQQSL